MGGEAMVTDASLNVLVERMNNYLDGQKRIEGQLSMLVQIQLAQQSMSEQIKTLQNGQEVLFDKSSKINEAIQPLRDEMVGNRRSVRVLSIIGSLVVAAAGGLYSQWKPWQEDMQKAKSQRDDQISKYQFDVGQELRKDDNRITVLEFRANNVDNKASK
jgi:hypothetical protein